MELLVFRYGKNAVKVLMYGEISPVTVELITDELLERMSVDAASVEVNGILTRLTWTRPDKKLVSIKWKVKKGK